MSKRQSTTAAVGVEADQRTCPPGRRERSLNHFESPAGGIEGSGAGPLLVITVVPPDKLSNSSRLGNLLSWRGVWGSAASAGRIR